MRTRSADLWLTLALCLTLAGLVWAVFGQTLDYDFVNFDDNRTVYDNPAISSGLKADSVHRAFTHSLNDNWLPLTALSHMLDCQIHGVKPRGHHLTNVLLQALVGILLFLFLRDITGAMGRSFFVAAAFAIHPLRVESVAWISERKDVLSGVFFVLTLWTFCRYAKSACEKGGSIFSVGGILYALSLFLFALGLLSKSMLVTVPFVLLLLDFWPLNRLEQFTFRKIAILVAEKIPFFALALATCIATLRVQQSVTVPLESCTFLARLGNAFVSCVVYLWQMVWPVRLIAFYPHPGNRLSPTLAILSALAVLAISTAAILQRRNLSYVFTGWFWYLGMLVPVIGLVQVGGQAHADRYTYLPQIGIYFAIAWGLERLFCGLPRGRIALGVAGTATVLFLAVAAHTQTTYWRNSITLWTHTLESGADNPFAQNDLAIALVAENKLPEAIEHYQTALQLKPDYAEAHNNYGLALMREGKMSDAGREFLEVTRSRPDFARAHFNLGNVLTAMGHPSEAAQSFQRAIELEPDFPEALYNLGNLCAAGGNHQQAADNFERTVKLQPGFVDAWNNLSIALTRLNKFPEAAEACRQVLTLQTNDIRAYVNLANALTLQGKTAEAIENYRHACALKPDSAEAVYCLGNALAVAGQVPEGVQEMQRASELATQQNQTPLAEMIQKRIALFQAQTSH